MHEVETTLKKYVPKTKPATYFDPASYMGTGFSMLGLNVPLQREIFKKGYSFSKLALEEQMKIWDKIWNETKIFETLTQAMFFPGKHVKKLDQDQLLNMFQHWIKRIDNWGHSDMLSSILAKMLVNHEKSVFVQLKKWNASKNPWEKRQSIVPLAMYHRSNNHLDYKEVIHLVNNLLEDDHYFVQKGVGWSLREIGTQYPSEIWKFLNDNVKKISPVAFTASVEKIPADKKEKLKLLRKKK